MNKNDLTLHEWHSNKSKSFSLIWFYSLDKILGKVYGWEQRKITVTIINGRMLNEVWGRQVKSDAENLKPRNPLSSAFFDVKL